MARKQGTVISNIAMLFDAGWTRGGPLVVVDIRFRLPRYCWDFAFSLSTSDSFSAIFTTYSRKDILTKYRPRAIESP